MGVKYKNIGGSHVTHDGTVVGHGEVFESEDPDLLKKFPFKFVRHFEDPVPEKTAAQSAAEKGAEGIASGSEEQEGSGYKDVTEEFPTAKEVDLTVKKNKAGWWVFDDAADPINDAPLKKKDVAAFIEEYNQG